MADHSNQRHRAPQETRVASRSKDCCPSQTSRRSPSTARPSPYLPSANQGVDIRPRALWLVEPNPHAQVLDPQKPYLRSSKAAVAAASKEWKDVAIAGQVEAAYLYATSISVEPFRLGAIVLAALPARLNDDETVTVLQRADVLARGDVGMRQWLEACEEAYAAVLKANDRKKTISVVSYPKHSEQARPAPPEGRSGRLGQRRQQHTPPRCCQRVVKQVGGLPVQGFVVDLNQYTVNCASWDEAHSLGRAAEHRPRQ